MIYKGRKPSVDVEKVKNSKEWLEVHLHSAMGIGRASVYRALRS